MVEATGTPIPGEQEGGSSLNPNEQEKLVTDAIKEKAREKGWRSKKDWISAGRDPADWVPAKEFIGRQSLFDKIKSQNELHARTIAAHQEEMTQIRKYIAQQSEIEYKRALKELQGQKREAVANADEATVAQIDKEIDDVKQAQANLQAQNRPTAQPEHPLFAQWKQDNPWYESDPEMRAEADSIGVGYASMHQDVAKSNPQKVLDHIVDRVKKLYPEKFEKAPAQKANVKPASKVEGSTGIRSNVSESSKTAISWDDLTREQKAIANTIIRSGALNDKAAKNKVSAKDQYLNDLASTMTVV